MSVWVFRDHGNQPNEPTEGTVEETSSANRLMEAVVDGAEVGVRQAANMECAAAEEEAEKAKVSALKAEIVELKAKAEKKRHDEATGEGAEAAKKASAKEKATAKGVKGAAEDIFVADATFAIGSFPIILLALNGLYHRWSNDRFQWPPEDAPSIALWLATVSGTILAYRHWVLGIWRVYGIPGHCDSPLKCLHCALSLLLTVRC